MEPEITRSVSNLLTATSFSFAIAKLTCGDFANFHIVVTCNRAF